MSLRSVLLRCAAFLRDEDGGVAVTWMYPFLLLLILAGVTLGLAGLDSEGPWTRMTLAVPVSSLLGR